MKIEKFYEYAGKNYVYCFEFYLYFLERDDFTGSIRHIFHFSIGLWGDDCV